MRIYTIIGFVIFIIIASLLAGITSMLALSGDFQPVWGATTNMEINSPVFSYGDRIPIKYTCSGDNSSVPLSISDVPANAQSLALIMDDPDAPGGNFNHWLMWNIDPAIKEIPENNIPQGVVQGTNDAGKTNYVGPCSPSGTHRYFFKVYALDTKLDLSESAKKTDLENAMNGHIVAQGELMGKYAK